MIGEARKVARLHARPEPSGSTTNTMSDLRSAIFRGQIQITPAVTGPPQRGPKSEHAGTAAPCSPLCYAAFWSGIVEVKFNPSKDETGSGLTAFASWDNPDLQRALEIAFRVNRNREQIDKVEVTAEGITARLSYRPHPVTA